ncbi:MAG: GNAT family N-acetyltransferase [Clostridia bacterium]|nr:GNAT family N-acetyltransferase [Clostridia bacterium]
MDLNTTLETNRLLIRSYKRDDKDFCLSLWCDAQNGKYMSDPLLENADEKYLSYFDDMENEPDGYYLIVESKDTRQRVGTCCIFPEGDNVDIGYCISKDLWRQGLGSEIIEALITFAKRQGGHSMSAEVADDNAASVGLLRKFGFVEDKKTRYKKWGEETYFDAHVLKLRF